MTASFIKEMVRRAVLESALDRADGADVTAPTVTTRHLEDALSDLLHHAAPVLLSALGARPEVVGMVGPEDDPAGLQATSGWMAFGPSPQQPLME